MRDKTRFSAFVTMALAVALGATPLACDPDDSSAGDMADSGGSEGGNGGGDVCEQATEKYEGECGLMTTDEGQACEGEVECAAQCVLDAPCEEMEEALDPAVFLMGGNDYSACVLECAAE